MQKEKRREKVKRVLGYFRSAGLLLALLSAFLALPTTSLQAQSIESWSLVENYDLDATSFTYCVLPHDFVVGVGQIQTTGPSTSLTAVGTATPFAGLAENDIIQALNLTTGAVESRYIITFTSSTAVTVDSNIDLSGGVNFSYKHLACGTTATDGWFNMARYTFASINVLVKQLNTTTGIDFRWECRGSALGATATQVCPTTVNTVRTVTTAGITDGAVNCAIEEPYEACRVGMKMNTTDDGGDTGANREQIFISLVGRR